ncbi:hypothetical protein RB594_000796 [Gaeumannomyces avenae]
MLRRIVSLGQQASESDEHMSRSTEDAVQSENRSTGGLASVFKNLTGARLTKSPPPQLPVPPAPSPAQLFVDPTNATRSSSGVPSTNSPDALEQLRSGTINDRVQAATSLRIAIANCPLASVLEIWYAGKDLIEPGKGQAARLAGWELVTECVKHKESTDLERREYFQTISVPANPEDFHLQLAALVDLTRRGRDVSGFEYDVVPLLITWLQEKFKAVKDAKDAAKDAAKEARRNGARSVSRNSKGKAAVSGEEKNFQQLFAFVSDVVKFNFKVTDDASASNLIECLLDICVSTSSEEDLRSCITVFNSIVTFGAIPSGNLARFVNVLSSIFSMVPSLAKAAWQVLSNICKSHHGNPMVQVLLNVLLSYRANGKPETQQREQREVRGTLEVLQKLVWKTSVKGYPAVPLNPLVDGLVNVINNKPTPRICNALLQLINSLFDDGTSRLNSSIADEEWAVILEVASLCSRKSRAVSARTDGGVSLGSHPGSIKATSTESLDRGDPIAQELGRLVGRLEQLLFEKRSDFMQRQDCIVFFTKIHDLLPDSAAGLVLDYFDEFHCCFPSDLQWEDNIKLVVESFYLDRGRSSLVRSRGLRTITAVIDMLELIGQESGQYSSSSLIKNILRGVPEETDIMVLQETIAFLVSVSPSADRGLFESITDSLKGALANDRLRDPLVSAPVTPTSGAMASQSPSNAVATGYVQIFMRTMDTDARKANKAFNAIVHIARSKQCETDARLTAMNMLFRLRADWAGRIFLTTFTESEALAATLFRTEASLARKLSDDAQHARPSRVEQVGPNARPGRAISFGQAPHERDRGNISRSTSGTASIPGATASVGRYRQTWSLPDPDALPQTPSSTSSPVLLCVSPKPTEKRPHVPALSMASWLEALITVLHAGCDWEIYSFIIVHLPSQLSNHALFKGAIPQIQQIRGILCEIMRMNMFQEPPLASGIRKPEVAVCFYHILTMIMSYHAHFQKSEEDEIVQTFSRGISDKTAKCCIHALTMACHELPLSTSRCLVAILQKMSQIITQQGVAIHILEFLACLSRLPSLYSNFREDEYRIVFGICFRYLQDVRNRRSLSRMGNASEPPTPSPFGNPDVFGPPAPSDDLPQYVYALAYHVITFWFLALKLPDRANHVGWIAKNLFSDADGGPPDEQAQITIDFMQRVAFADADDSIEDTLFTQERFGEMKEKCWIIGNSIVTIKQATKSGWAQITKRQPSGTSCFVVRESVKPPAPHHIGASNQENGRDGQLLGSTVFPSHVLVQLLSSIPQAFDSTLRPIPLPEDEVVGRAIRMFDRSPALDGHKVGVVYIGEGQTKETEILANVSGSSDYVEFLNGLGTLTKLKGATFNTQGLDREYDTDGQYTFCWRDRVTELVFHVTTQMPTNLDHDALCINKKRHIGNDFVNIIFNDSGQPFKFDTFPSEFNYVNIVITPVSRASFIASRERTKRRADKEAGGESAESGGADEQSSFYKVQVMSKPGFPEISPAADTKMVSLRALPDFIRLLALNASVFSLVWSNRAGGEHVGTWRNRLREINRMRERYGPKPTAPSPSPPPTASGGAGIGGIGSAMGPLSMHPQHAMGGAGGMAGSTAGSISSALDASRPASSMRDSFSSLRRSSVATFFTTASEQTSHRSSMLSAATTENTEVVAAASTVDSLVNSLDFSKWAA